MRGLHALHSKLTLVSQCIITLMTREQSDVVYDLGLWTSIRKFAIHQPLVGAKMTWDFLSPPFDIGDVDEVNEELRREHERLKVQLLEKEKIPFLDEPNPPAFHERREPMTLAALRQTKAQSSWYRTGWDRLLLGIRRALRLDDDAELDEGDAQLLLRAWEAHSYPRVSRWVRHAAVLCPALEAFDWYVVEQPGRAVLWEWKIGRTETGGVRFIRGNLTWTGCLQGSPSPFGETQFPLPADQLDYEHPVTEINR